MGRFTPIYNFHLSIFNDGQLTLGLIYEKSRPVGRLEHFNINSNFLKSQSALKRW